MNLAPHLVPLLSGLETICQARLAAGGLAQNCVAARAHDYRLRVAENRCSANTSTQ